MQPPFAFFSNKILEPSDIVSLKILSRALRAPVPIEEENQVEEGEKS